MKTQILGLETSCGGVKPTKGNVMKQRLINPAPPSMVGVHKIANAACRRRATKEPSAPAPAGTVAGIMVSIAAPGDVENAQLGHRPHPDKRPVANQMVQLVTGKP